MSNETDRAVARPWTVDTEDPSVVRDTDGWEVCECQYGKAHDLTGATDAYRAALIVAAVNAHDALVEACEAALAAIGGIGTEDQGLMNVGTEENPNYETAFGLAVNEVEIDDAIELVKAALALARGE